MDSKFISGAAAGSKFINGDPLGIGGSIDDDGVGGGGGSRPD